MLARRGFWLVLLAATMTGACSDTSGPDEQPDANGTWAGTLTHPAYDGGSLTLTLIDANGAVSGNYKLILSKRVGSRVGVEQSGGRITGSVANRKLTLMMERSDGDSWLLEGSLDNSTANGEWSNSRRVRGSFAVNR
jgi:hypothetical protein